MSTAVDASNRLRERAHPLLEHRPIARVSTHARFVDQLITKNRRIISIELSRDGISTPGEKFHVFRERVSTFRRRIKIFTSPRVRVSLLSRPLDVSIDTSVIGPIIRERQDDAQIFLSTRRQQPIQRGVTRFSKIASRPLRKSPIERFLVPIHERPRAHDV